jgi:hypothetical protein
LLKLQLFRKEGVVDIREGLGKKVITIAIAKVAGPNPGQQKKPFAASAKGFFLS